MTDDLQISPAAAEADRTEGLPARNTRESEIKLIKVAQRIVSTEYSCASNR
jgi:hypothetical protein